MAVVMLVVGWVGAGARAGEAEAGRQAFADTCSKCHGVIAERRLSRRYGALLVPVVMSPLGPNLTGVYGRPAGIYAGYRYSNGLKQVAKGIVWNDQSLDRWLTNSQAMIRGSYMFIKVKQPMRAKIIAYLKTFSRYQK